LCFQTLAEFEKSLTLFGNFLTYSLQNRRNGVKITDLKDTAYLYAESGSAAGLSVFIFCYPGKQTILYNGKI